MKRFFTHAFFISGILTGPVFTAGAQTISDGCGAGAGVLTPDYTCVTTNYTVASSFTADAPAAASCVTAGNNREDGWFRFVATATTTTVTVTANRDVVLAVYSTACPAAGTEVACADAGGSGTTETVTFTSVIGTTYYVRIIRYDSGANNNMTGTVCVTVPPPPPANDNCPGAIAITAGATCTATAGTTAGATATAGVGTPPCSTYGNNDVWFRFTAPGPNLEISTTAGSLTDGAMSVYSGSCAALTHIECDDDDGPGSMPYITRCDFVTGNTYYIRVWGFSGASGTFSICVNNFGGGASGTTTNCVGGTTVCNDASFSGNSSGAGAAELTGTTDGCLSGENQSSWYFFQTTTAGTVQLNITPSNGTDDYDFAIWGPYTGGVVCPPCTAPLRCSWAAGGGTTGLVIGAGDNSEGSGGNRFVNAINSGAGDQYVLLVDNYSSSSSPFTLDWTLTGGASLGCTVLPIQLTEFNGVNEGTRNRLYWTTASETDNNYFILERSTDGFNYTTVAQVPGAGTSNSPLHYRAYDENPPEMAYYRLRQTDFNGHFVYSNVVPIKAGAQNNISLEVYPVPAHDQLEVLFNEGIPENTVIYMTDLAGRVLMTQATDAASGRQLTLEISHLQKGLYLLVAESKLLDKRSSIRKIIIE